MKDDILIVGIGGTLRAGSSTERAVQGVLRHAQAAGAKTIMYSGPAVNFPMYAPENPERSPEALQYIEDIRNADAVIFGSPGYHGGISGLIKNAIDYTEDMSKDTNVYLAGKAVGCVATGFGWQGANSALHALRLVVHALRGWVTPLGIALNTKEKLFDENGNCLRDDVDGQLKIMAAELIEFASARKKAQQVG
ncbi:MAG: NADPH-dependent FMN reductase [Porticoccaceae bacterium]